MANSKQHDIVGARLMRKLSAMSNDSIEFTGYGGSHMKRDGLNSTLDFDLEMVPNKEFVTYRKGRNMNEESNAKWNPFNLVNKHFTRKTNHVYDLMMEASLPRRIYQSRPDLILNIGNEYMTFLMMEELLPYY